jgi:salicylate 5-hydroxylase small subunit
MRHVLSPAQVLSDEAGVITAQTHYAVFRTRPAGVSEVYNVGRYLDQLVRTGEGLKLQKKLCVYDSEMVLNSLIYPV